MVTWQSFTHGKLFGCIQIFWKWFRNFRWIEAVWSVLCWLICSNILEIDYHHLSFRLGECAYESAGILFSVLFENLSTCQKDRDWTNSVFYRECKLWGVFSSIFTASQILASDQSKAKEVFEGNIPKYWKILFWPGSNFKKKIGCCGLKFNNSWVPIERLSGGLHMPP